MNCAFDKEKLTGYFDGELVNAEKGEVEKHISACSECLRELGEIKSAAKLVKTLPRLKAPLSIAEGVRREVASTGRVHSLAKYRKSIAWTFSAAAALLVVATVSYFAGQDGRPAGLATRPSAPAATDLARIEPGRDALDARKKVGDGEAGNENKLDELRRRRQDRPTEEQAESGAKRDEKAPPLPGFGKRADALEKELTKDAGRAPENRALAEDAKKLASKPAEAPAPPQKPAAAAPAPVESKPQTEGLAKKASVDEKAAAPAPAKSEPARQESLREAPLALKDADKAAGRLEMQQQKQNANGTSHVTVGSPQLAATRAKAREVLAKWGVAEANAAPAFAAKTAAPEPASITVDLTPSQFAELKKQLEAQSGVRLVAGVPQDTAQSFRAAGPAGGVGGGAGKLAEDPKAPSATRGVTSAPSAPAPVAKGGDGKQPGQGAKAEEERKDRQAAGEKVEKVEKADKAKESKESDTLGAVHAQGEPRQKFVLYFIEVPATK